MYYLYKIIMISLFTGTLNLKSGHTYLLRTLIQNSKMTCKNNIADEIVYQA